MFLCMFKFNSFLIIVILAYWFLEQCYAEKQALGEVSPELLDTQVNPAVWEISGHMVLKRKMDFEEASEENAWRLLAEVSLSEERFQEVKQHIFEAIVGGDNGSLTEELLEDDSAATKSHEEVDSTNRNSKPAIVSGTKECIVLQ